MLTSMPVGVPAQVMTVTLPLPLALALATRTTRDRTYTRRRKWLQLKCSLTVFVALHVVLGAHASLALR